MTKKIIKRLFHLYWRFSRPMTLGVRAIVEDDKGQIVMVRHTYVSGWHLPGGGVEAGETIEDAVQKELAEETNIQISGRPKLIGFFKNNIASNRDHVALFHVREFEAGSLPEPNREIAEVSWFPIRELPFETTPSTRRRIDEFLNDEAVDPLW